MMPRKKSTAQKPSGLGHPYILPVCLFVADAEVTGSTAGFGKQREKFPELRHLAGPGAVPSKNQWTIDSGAFWQLDGLGKGATAILVP